MHLMWFTCLLVLVLARPKSDEKNSNRSEKQGKGPHGRRTPWTKVGNPWTRNGMEDPNGNKQPNENNTDDYDYDGPCPEGILIEVPDYDNRNPRGGGNGYYPWSNNGYGAPWQGGENNYPWNPWNGRFYNSQPTGRRQIPSKRRGNGNRRPRGPLEHIGDDTETRGNSGSFALKEREKRSMMPMN
ncbi:hypothetical protein RB195_003851 [Necator americanus]|uniref:Uncharacterized protein n=1 Tax=Necator americanus TaxID=51031 RepID=A0ABR1DQH3_NECAM